MDKYKIDYSKWDRMEDSDDDDDNNDGDRTPKHPQVTVFDQPTRVTFGGVTTGSNPDNDIEFVSSLTSSTSDAKSRSETDSSSKIEILDSAGNAAVANTSTPAIANDASTKRPIATDEFGIPLSWTENGASIELSSLDKEKINQNVEYSEPSHEEMQINDRSTTPNTSVDFPSEGTMIPYKYFWSQDRIMVHIRIPIQSHQKLKYHVHVSNLLSYPDRHCATITTDSAKQRLVVTSSSLQGDSQSKKNDTVVVLEGTLTYPVYVPEDYDDDEVDWSVQNCSVPMSSSNNHGETDESNTDGTRLCRFEKYILITLYKATPMMGMTIWWKRCLTSETNNATIVHNNINDTEQRLAFQKAWDEAHEQFQQTMQSRTKYSL